MLKFLMGNKFRVAAISGYIFLISTIFFFQLQKDSLRDDVTDITAEKQALETFYKAELERINTKHNQIIQDMITEEERERLEKQITRLREQREFEQQRNAELIKNIDELNEVENDLCLDTEISEELGEILK